MGNKAEKKLSSDLARLAALVEWFETQKEVDIEEGLVKIKEGAELIKGLKTRLKAIENEFEEVKKELKRD